MNLANKIEIQTLKELFDLQIKQTISLVNIENGPTIYTYLRVPMSKIGIVLSFNTPEQHDSFMNNEHTRGMAGITIHGSVASSIYEFKEKLTSCYSPKEVTSCFYSDEFKDVTSFFVSRNTDSFTYVYTSSEDFPNILILNNFSISDIEKLFNLLCEMDQIIKVAKPKKSINLAKFYKPFSKIKSFLNKKSDLSIPIWAIIFFAMFAWFGLTSFFTRVFKFLEGIL